VTPAAATAHAGVQQRWTRGLQADAGRSRHGAAVVEVDDRLSGGSTRTPSGVQQRSMASHEYVLPQSHSSRRSTTASPHVDRRGSRQAL